MDSVLRTFGGVGDDAGVDHDCSSNRIPNGKLLFVFISMLVTVVSCDLATANIIYLYEQFLQDVRVFRLAGIQLLVESLVREDGVGSVADNGNLGKVGGQCNLGGFGVNLEVNLLTIRTSSFAALSILGDDRKFISYLHQKQCPTGYGCRKQAAG